jgi:hypothetical protein
MVEKGFSSSVEVRTPDCKILACYEMSQRSSALGRHLGTTQATKEEMVLETSDFVNLCRAVQLKSVTKEVEVQIIDLLNGSTGQMRQVRHASEVE